MSDEVKREMYTTPPKFVVVRNDLFMICQDNNARRIANLALKFDNERSRDSQWWGHPETGTLSDGTPTIRIPFNSHNYYLLMSLGAEPNFDSELTSKRCKNIPEMDLVLPPNTQTAYPSRFPLMPFQKSGVDWIIRNRFRGVLAFDAGLGKTMTTLASLLVNPTDNLPAVIIAPAHVKLNWENEWVKWGGDPERVVVLFGKKPNPDILNGKSFIVLNQHILPEWCSSLIGVHPKTLIIDEAHNFVGSNTKTYKYVEMLARECHGRSLLLTATPLVNDLGDMWGLCNIMNPDILGTKKVFVDTFMPEEEAKRRMFATRWRGNYKMQGAWQMVFKHKLPKELMSRRIDELKEILHGCGIVLRKRKSEVMTQLPKITETHLTIDIPKDTPEGREFWRIENQCVMDIDNGKTDILSSEKMLAAIALERRNAAVAKIPYAEEWIRAFLDESEESEKLVVAGWSVEPLKTLASKFRNVSLLINGEVSAKRKKEIGDNFMNDPKRRVLFGNYKSIGTGIDNLVAARTMMLFELPLTEVDFVQVKGRIDRVSQKSDSLAYYYMTIRGAYESTAGWRIINRKKNAKEELAL